MVDQILENKTCKRRLFLYHQIRKQIQKYHTSANEKLLSWHNGIELIRAVLCDIHKYLSVLYNLGQSSSNAECNTKVSYSSSVNKSKNCTMMY